MRFVLVAISLLVGSEAFAGYDATWYRQELWSGEWPSGFAVVKPDVTIMARTAMDKDLKPTVSCRLPYRAVFSPWNTARNKASNAHYWTASKIVRMTAKQAFTFEDQNDDAVKVPLKKGEAIEYLMYYAEGIFAVRVRGKKYTVDQSLLEKVDSPPDPANPQEEWLSLTCTDGQAAWIAMSDLVVKDKAGEEIPMDGLWRASMDSPGVPEHGKARDLTDAEIVRGPQ